jgi:hypothetical protein
VNGALIMSTPGDGSYITTSHNYPRCELRHNTNFDPTVVSGKMTVTMAINSMPTSYKLVFGQIHSTYYETFELIIRTDRVVYFSQSLNTGSYFFYLTNSSGNQLQLPLNTYFTYVVTMDQPTRTLSVSLVVNGLTYTASTTYTDYWATDKVYFKTGVYQQCGIYSPTYYCDATNTSQVSICSVNVSFY